MSHTTYAEKLRDPRWQRKRLGIFHRDRFTCRDCGTKDQELHVHHCYYEKGEPWEIDDQYLLTLCADCHKLRGRIERRLRYLMGMIFARSSQEALEGLDEYAVAFISKCDADVEEYGAGNDEFMGVPILLDENDYGMEADMRWFQAAHHDPAARPAYEKVTGTKPKWREP